MSTSCFATVIDIVVVHLVKFFALIVLFSLWGRNASGEQLDAQQLLNLIGGAEGTTIVLNGGADRIYLSLTVTNELRRSAELGPSFMKNNVRSDAVREGVFFASLRMDGKPVLIKGVSAVVADQTTGGGVVALLQSYPEDKSRKSFDSRDRFVSAVFIDERAGVLECRQLKWERVAQPSGRAEFKSGPCEFLVGNVVPGAGRQ